MGCKLELCHGGEEGGVEGVDIALPGRYPHKVSRYVEILTHRGKGVKEREEGDRDSSVE